MSIISGGFPKYSIRDYVMGLSSNGYVLKDVGCGEYATTTAICHGGDTEYGLVLGPHQDDLWGTTAVCFTHGENRGGDCTYTQRMRNIRAAAGLPDHPPSSGPRPKKGKGASASAAPPRLTEAVLPPHRTPAVENVMCESRDKFGHPVHHVDHKNDIAGTDEMLRQDSCRQ